MELAVNAIVGGLTQPSPHPGDTRSVAIAASFTRLLVRVVAFDIGIAIPLVLVWTLLLGIADLRVVVVLGVIRIAVMVAQILHLLRPLRRWHERGRELDDRELLDADEALQRAYSRFAVGYVLGWLLADLASVMFARIGMPHVIALGPAELLLATLIAIAFAVGSTPLLLPMFRTSLAGLERELAAQLVARRLDQQRTRSSFASNIQAMFMCATLSLLVGMTAIGAGVRIEGLRELALAKLQHRVELAALVLQSGATTSSTDAELVIVAGRPTPAAARVEASDALLRSYDPERARAEVAVALGDDRWLLGHVDVDEQLEWPLLFVFGLLPFIVIPTFLVSRAQFRAHSEALRQLGQTTRDVLSTGRVRGLSRVVPLRNDEVGTLVREFNGVLDVLDELAAAATSVAAGDLRVRLERPGDLYDAFRGMVMHLHEMVMQIRVTSLELASAAAEIHAVTSEQERAANTQSISVGEVEAAIGSLASSAAGIADTAEGVLDDAEHALATTDVMATKIGELSHETTRVGELLDLIQEIAQRSDLLALNGSLEATRVGELGRGFAIVAAEMRRLAERVTGTIADVRERVADIRSAGASTVMATDDSRKRAQRSAQAARQISTLTHQQSQETAAVAFAVAAVTKAVIEQADATAQAQAASQGLRSRAEGLEQLTRRFTLRSPKGEDDHAH